MTAPRTAEPRTVRISPAQQRVLDELMRDGADTDIIARRLTLSPWTVRSHMNAVLKATGQPTRTALAVALFRGQLRIHRDPR